MNGFVGRASMDNPVTERRLSLGPLEIEVMEVVWTFGANNVREVATQDATFPGLYDGDDDA